MDSTATTTGLLATVRHLADQVVLAECELDRAMTEAYHIGAVVADIAHWADVPPDDARRRIADWEDCLSTAEGPR